MITVQHLERLKKIREQESRGIITSSEADSELLELMISVALTPGGES